MQYNDLAQCQPQQEFSVCFGQPGTYNVNLQLQLSHRFSTNQHPMVFYNMPYGPPTHMQPIQQFGQQCLYSIPASSDPRAYSYHQNQYHRPQGEMQDHTYATIDNTDASMFCNPPSGNCATRTPGSELSDSWKYMSPANTSIPKSESIYEFPQMISPTNGNNGLGHCNMNNGFMNNRPTDFNHTGFPNSNLGASANTPESRNHSCFPKKCNLM